MRIIIFRTLCPSQATLRALGCSWKSSSFLRGPQPSPPSQVSRRRASPPQRGRWGPTLQAWADRKSSPTRSSCLLVTVIRRHKHQKAGGGGASRGVLLKGSEKKYMQAARYMQHICEAGNRVGYSYNPVLLFSRSEVSARFVNNLTVNPPPTDLQISKMK